MSLRDSIVGDFAAIVDDLERVTFHSRETGRAVGESASAKRFAERDQKQAEESFGFAVSDYVSFKVPATEFKAGFYPSLGDWLEDKSHRRYALVSLFHSRMTEVVKLRTISLAESLNSTVTVLESAGNTSTGAPGENTIPRHSAVPARIWPYDQGASDYLGDNLRPRFRCAFYADGRSLRLPLPQKFSIRHDQTGALYDATTVRNLDKLAGFVFVDMVLADAKKVW